MALQTKPNEVFTPALAKEVYADLAALTGTATGNTGPVTGMQVCQATLVAGVATVAAGITITASSQVFTSMEAPGGTIGSDWKVPTAGMVVGAPGTGAFTVTAINTSGATVTTDTSVLNCLIVN